MSRCSDGKAPSFSGQQTGQQTRDRKKKEDNHLVQSAPVQSIQSLRSTPSFPSAASVLTQAATPLCSSQQPAFSHLHPKHKHTAANQQDKTSIGHSNSSQNYCHFYSSPAEHDEPCGNWSSFSRARDVSKLAPRCLSRPAGSGNARVQRFPRPTPQPPSFSIDTAPIPRNPQKPLPHTITPSTCHRGAD